MAKWIYKEDGWAEWWEHSCGGAITDDTMIDLVESEAKYCPFCGKKCTYEYKDDEDEDEEWEKWQKEWQAIKQMCEGGSDDSKDNNI